MYRNYILTAIRHLFRNKIYLVNETFAREAGWRNPIGQNIRVYDKQLRVIGVVKDHYFQPLMWKLKAQVYSLTLGRGVRSVYIKIRPGSGSAALPFIEKTFKPRMPLSPYYYSFKDQENRATYAAASPSKQILSFAAA